MTKLAELIAGSPAKPQPITTKPELGLVGGKPIVMVATGRYLDDPDAIDKNVQSMYGIIDDPYNTTLTRSDLTQRSFVSPTGVTTVAAAAGGAKGWYIDMPILGERIVIDPRLQLGTLTFISAAPSDDPCQPGGQGFVNFVDYRSGSFVPGPGGATTARVPLDAGMGMGASIFRLPDGTLVNISPTSQPGTPASTVIHKSLGNVTGRRMTWREVM